MTRNTQQSTFGKYITSVDVEHGDEREYPPETTCPDCGREFASEAA